MYESVLQAAWEGLRLLCSWPNILYPVAGTLLAMLFALIPGISGFTLMSLAIPFTYSWDPTRIMLFFGPLVGGATFAGSITAILFNVPGSPPSAATMFDGHPLAKRGEAKTAIACSAAASALGSTFGILILIALVPVMRMAVLSFGAPESLMLAVWGLSSIAILTKGSPIKGLAAAGLGLLLAFIGSDLRSGEDRFTLGWLHLRDGIGQVPVFLGMFALAEIFELILSGRRTIAEDPSAAHLAGSVRRGIASVFRHFGLFLRCSVIGTVIGMIPGIGGTVASFVAYGHAAQSDREGAGTFGQGDIRGVIAPEAAHDAKDGGSLVPVFALGIPGSAGTALLIAVLTLHGMAPGGTMMSQHLGLVFVLIWALFLSNWLTSIVGMLAVGPIARLTQVRIRLMMPVLLAMTALGAYLGRERIEDVFTAFAFGLLGLGMKMHGWPRVPLLVALVLASFFEVNLHITRRLHELGRIDLWNRPIVLVLIALTLFSVIVPYFRIMRPRAREGRR
ncbi:MAG: tripartite tricarboxylate transporter permease [Candidatus Eisenbacteria bacterium]|nr:tripartite tricarboxylate transporter permease [Candidatus Eisenbacteria bacterium]